MLEDPEERLGDLIQECGLLGFNLRTGMAETATIAQANAWMRHLAPTADKVTDALRQQVCRRRALEEEAKSGLYLQGAGAMAEALVRAEHNAKESRHWLDAAEIEKRAAEARKAYDRASYIKLALVAASAAAIVVFVLYGFRRATFYSLAGSALLLGAAGTLLAAVAAWIDLPRRQKTALDEANYWFKVGASETVRAQELKAKQAAYWARLQAEAEASDPLDDEDESD